MKLTIDPTIFEAFPDLNVGVVAIKGLDNLTADRDIEAFLRHASLEAGLLLSLKPLASDHGVRAYRAALAKLGGAGEDCVPAMEAVLRELGEGSRRLFELEARCTDLYGLCFPAPRPCGAEWIHSPVVGERA